MGLPDFALAAVGPCLVGLEGSDSGRVGRGVRGSAGRRTRRWGRASLSTVTRLSCQRSREPRHPQLHHGVPVAVPLGIPIAAPLRVAEPDEYVVWRLASSLRRHLKRTERLSGVGSGCEC